MISNISLSVCRTITGCKTLVQLAVAERYMALSGKDFTDLVLLKKAQLNQRLEVNSRINSAINTRLTEIVKR
tara:strand:+ start:54 stop:269 length:216 start_codon:yes stop_codon:yes gene_type:complete